MADFATSNGLSEISLIENIRKQQRSSRIMQFLRRTSLSLFLLLVMLLSPFLEHISSVKAQGDVDELYELGIQYITYMEETDTPDPERLDEWAADYRRIDDFRFVRDEDIDQVDKEFYLLLGRDLRFNLFLAENREDLVESGEPIGIPHYKALLERLFMQDVAIAAMTSITESDYDHIQSRMNQLALEIDPEAESWRDVYPTIRENHPESGDVLAAYDTAVQRVNNFVEENNLLSAQLLDQLPPLDVSERPSQSGEDNISFAVYAPSANAIWVIPESENIPLEKHCQACLPHIAARLGLPGRHAQMSIQTMNSPYEDDATDIGKVRNYLYKNGHTAVFRDGWGLMAEWLLIEHGFYETPEAELMALHAFLMHTTRANLDAQIHTGLMSQEEAVAFLTDELLLAPEIAEAEVEDFLQHPADAVAAYGGLRQILALRSASYLQDNPDTTTEDLNEAMLDASFDANFADALLNGEDYPFPVVSLRLDLTPESAEMVDVWSLFKSD